MDTDVIWMENLRPMAPNAWPWSRCSQDVLGFGPHRYLQAVGGVR